MEEPAIDAGTVERVSERYPFYEVKKIPWNPPSAYFQPKKVFEKEPEEEPVPTRPPSRKVNKDALSPGQRQLYGKSLFEKDLMILRDRGQRQERKETRESAPSLPPSLYFREERMRKRKREEEMEEHENNVARMMRREKKWKKKVESEREKVRAAILARKEAKENEDEWEHRKRVQEVLERAKKAAEIREELGDDRNTRASSLKYITGQRMSDREGIEMRRLRLNSELRKEKSRRIRKKLIPIMDKIQQDMEPKTSTHMKKQKMLATERQWQAWLDLTEKTNEKRKSLVERTQYQCDAAGNAILRNGYR